MSRITEQLLRKRAQHNQCMLTSLQQISLHQQEIVKIQNFDILCRHLKILYLQNNIIQKLQNLNKLKQLQYLNIALNNISKIQNIQGCESLRKLDFTVNFIDAQDLQESAICLSKLPNIKQLYLTGNPCQDWKGCQDYIIAMVPTLEVYNGTTITPSQRIKAIQQLPNLKSDLYLFAQMRRIQKRKKQIEMQDERRRRMMNGQKQDQKKPYTKQVRRQMYTQMAKDKQKKQRQKNPQKFKQKVVSPMFNKQGQIRQCNQGRYPFRLRQYDHPQYVYFQLQVPKFLDTKSLEVNINPLWISIRVKQKLTQLRLSEEIIVQQSKTQRSQITGILLITMKKVTAHNFIKLNDPKNEKIELKKKQNQKKKEQQSQRKRILKLCQQYENRKDDDDEVPPLQ